MLENLQKGSLKNEAQVCPKEVAALLFVHLIERTSITQGFFTKIFKTVEPLKIFF